MKFNLRVCKKLSAPLTSQTSYRLTMLRSQCCPLPYAQILAMPLIYSVEVEKKNRWE